MTPTVIYKQTLSTFMTPSVFCKILLNYTLFTVKSSFKNKTCKNQIKQKRLYKKISQEQVGIAFSHHVSALL